MKRILLTIFLLSSFSLPAGWNVVDGQFKVEDGKLLSDGKVNSIAIPIESPYFGEGQFQAILRINSRTVAGGWALAGIMLYLSPSDFWQLTLVEGPNGERYGELAEMRNGVWRAEFEDKLPVERSEKPFLWEYKKDYALKLAFNPRGIEGEIREVGGDAVYQIKFTYPAGVQAVKGGKIALRDAGFDAVFSEVNFEGKPMGFAQKRGKKIAIFQSDEEGYPRQLAEKLANSLRQSGREVEIVDEKSLTNPSFSRENYYLLILPDASFYPVSAKENLLSFLEGGGDLFCLGGPIFTMSQKMAKERWERIMEEIGRTPAERKIVDFQKEDLSRWIRASNDLSSPTKFSVVKEGPREGMYSLKLAVSNLTGWDTLNSPPLKEAFTNGQNLTCFWAKGDENTKAMLFEWREKDGSRWIATVPLSTSWQYYALVPEKFLYWPDNPSKGRGGAGDRFNPQNAESFSIGVALGHNTNLSPGPHTIWVAEIGSAKAEYPPQPDLSLPTIETLSPWYKYYELDDMTSIKAFPVQAFAKEDNHLEGRFSLVSPILRMRGLGFKGERTGRFIPILEAYDREGNPRGFVLSLYVNFSPPYLASTFGQLGIKDFPFLEDNWDFFFPLIEKVIEKMEDGIFLVKGGADYFSYFKGDKARIGAEAMNLSPKEKEVELRMRILRGKTEIWRRSESLTIPPMGNGTFSQEIPTEEVGLYTIRSELWEEGKLVDVIEQEVSVEETPNDPKDEFIYIKDGDFYLKGKKWYPHGMNYWPSYIAGQEVREYWLHWLSPGFYDPLIIERNLSLLERLGANMVSIQLGSREQVPQVNDFLLRAKRHGLKINLFLAGAHPLYKDEALFTDLIKMGRFKGNSTIFAYDIAWETHWGGYNERKRWDRDWEKWVVDRYGSIENAERDWGYPIPRDEKGNVTGPSDQQLRQDGPWLKMACAYSRFLDDFVSKAYGKVVRKIKELDPNHLISNRAASQPSWSGWFAYDMIGQAKHLDFLSPEGYGLKPEEAGFTTAYARFVSEGKPVFWAEFGYNIYPDETPENMRKQADYYASFYDMILDSQANGSACWWFPGGYRVDEKSDFGIINPDNTPRPAALVFQRYSHLIEAPRQRGIPQVWITIDRDLHTTNYEGVYNDNKRKYVEARREGKVVGIRMEGSGTNSLNTPLIAVGNVPYNGSNPPKYLNAEFNWVMIKDREGKWVELCEDGTVEVKKGKPIEMRVSVGNTGIAEWIAPKNAGGKKGGVYLVIEGLNIKRAISSNCPRLKDVELSFSLPAIERETEIRLYMEAEGRARFGEVLRIKLLP
ncbi:MAG: beta-galactosidase [bacterium]